MFWYKQDASSGFKEYYTKRESFSAKLSRTFVIYAVLVFIGITWFLIYAGLNYVDVSNRCVIKVKYNVTKGDRKSIVEAIDRIKATDFATYTSLCRYANTIYETQCMYADKKTEDYYAAPTEVCFIKGSRAVLLKPYARYSEDVVKKRVEQLTEGAVIATAYWTNPDTE